MNWVDYSYILVVLVLMARHVVVSRRLKEVVSAFEHCFAELRKQKDRANRAEERAVFAEAGLRVAKQVMKQHGFDMKMERLNETKDKSKRANQLKRL